MELQKKDQQKKLTWREIYLEETLNVLEDGGFYNRHCQFPRTIKLPITWKECMCELGGMGNQFSTVLLVSTPTGGYPVGMALYGIKPNGVQATIKVYEKSYVGIATRHCDYTHLAIYRISDMHKGQTFVAIEGYSFGSVDAVLCYSADCFKDGIYKSSDESLFTKNTNLELLKNKLLEKLSIRNCRTPIYIEPLVRLNANMNQGISNAIENGWTECANRNIICTNKWYGSEDLDLFHSDLMKELFSLQEKYKFVYVRSNSLFKESFDEEERSCNWYTEISILCNNNGDAEPLVPHSVLFTYEHSSDKQSVEIDNISSNSEKNNNFMRQFTRSYFTTLFGFKSWKEMEEIADSLKSETSVTMEPVITYSKFYLTTKQFFTKTELTK